jgi:hypothetical protein
MREIRQSGSEGGATDGRPYPYNREPPSMPLLAELVVVALRLL